MKAESCFSPLSLGLLWVLFNFLLMVRNLFVFFFTGVAPLVSYFAMKFKIIFSIQFFLCNSFNFQCSLSQNNFLINQLGVSVSMVFSYFNSINGFKIIT